MARVNATLSGAAAGISLLDGPGGLIGQLTARVMERALGAEMDDHVGYVKGDPANVLTLLGLAF